MSTGTLTFTCPGCGAKIPTDLVVWPFEDPCEKVLPGEPMPAGECPECEALIPLDAGVEEVTGAAIESDED